MRQKQCTPEEWIKHRKLRKKIASAKWYAKKKKGIIEEENQLRKVLEEQYQEKRRQPIWDELNRAYWKCVTDYMVRGFPPRPDDFAVYDWVFITTIVEQFLDRLKHENPWHGTIQWTHIKERTFRQLCIREVRAEYEKQGRRKSAIASAVQNGRGITTSDWWHIASGGQWPTMCSSVGLVFVQLHCIGRTDCWIDFCNAVKQVIIHHIPTIIHMDTRSDIMPIENPTHTPNANTLWDHPILNQWMTEWIQHEEDEHARIENDEEEEHLDTTHELDWLPEPDSLDSLFLHRYHYTEDDPEETQYHDRNYYPRGCSIDSPEHEQSS